MRRYVIAVAFVVAAAMVAAVGAWFLPAGLSAVPLGWRVILAMVTVVVLAKVLWLLVTAVPYLPLHMFEGNPGRHRLNADRVVWEPAA